MKISNNYLNLAFEELIKKSKSCLEEKLFDTCGYSSRVLLDRLVQYVMKITIAPYALEVNRLCDKSGSCCPASDTKINIGNAIIEIRTGRITITCKQWLVNQFNFIIHWLFCLVSIFTVNYSIKDNLPVVLLYGVGDEALFVDDNDKQFWDYCRLGPILPLRNGKRIYIESLRKPFVSEISEFRYCKRPLISLLRESKIGIFGRFRLLKNHLMLFFIYLYAVFRMPLLSMLGKEFAYSSISFELDKLKLIESIILTNSSYASQPLWLRALSNTKVHMIWYSQNMKTIDLTSETLKSNIPCLVWIRVDVHWVWTQSFASYLKSIGHDKSINVVGPIMWYLPKINQPDMNELKIVIFDISPYSDQIALDYGEISNYNHPKNLFSFIQDVISMKSKLEEKFHLPVSFCLKTKRGYNPAYDRAYFDYINELDTTGVISQKHHATNMYDLISRSHLVITYPFSSPAYIADFVKVPSVFYDPTNSISRHDFGDSDSLIKFANSPDDLFTAADFILCKTFSHVAIKNA